MLTNSKKTNFTYLRRVALLPLLMFICVLFAFRLKKEKMPLHKTMNDYTVIAKQSNENLENENQNTYKITDADFKDTTKNKKKDSKLKDKTITFSNVTFTNSDGNESTVPAAITYSAKDTGKLKKELVVLDGKYISSEELSKMDASKIKSVSVWKGEAAIKKYGEKGKDGVIEILSKLLNGENSLQQKKFEEQENLLKAQQNDEEKQAKYDKVFTIVENPPYYPDGMIAFAEYINKNVRYPKEALQNKIEGAVLIQFIVNEEGKLTGFKKVSDKRYGLEEEAIRLLKNSGEWKPGIQNGHKVPVQIQQQIIFELPKKE